MVTSRGAEGRERKLFIPTLDSKKKGNNRPSRSESFRERGKKRDGGGRSEERKKDKKGEAGRVRRRGKKEKRRFVLWMGKKT